MDIISFAKASQSLRNVRNLDTNIVGELAEGTFPSVDERLKWLEKQTMNSLYEENLTLDLKTGDRTNIKESYPLELINEELQGVYVSEVFDLGAHHKERKSILLSLVNPLINQDGKKGFNTNGIKVEYQVSSNSTSWNGYYTASHLEDLIHQNNTYTNYRYIRIKITITPIKKEIYDDENTLIDEIYEYDKIDSIAIHRTCLSPIGLLFRLDAAILIENLKLDFKVSQLLNKKSETFASDIIFANSKSIKKDATLTHDDTESYITGEGYIYLDGLYSPVGVTSIAVAILGDVESVELYTNEWEPITINEIVKLNMTTKDMPIRIQLKEGQKFYGIGLSWLRTI